jgi:hypothetical protein
LIPFTRTNLEENPMVKLPPPEERTEIARVPFVDDMVGVMVARLDDRADGPVIDVTVKPFETDMQAEFSLSPSDARGLADQLRAIADTAQRAGWTAGLVADVREKYLPGASDEQIMARLDRLTERFGGGVYGQVPDRLDWRAGRVLIAEDAATATADVVGVVDDVIGHLSSLADAAQRLSHTREVLAGAESRYQLQAESETRS